MHIKYLKKLNTILQTLRANHAKGTKQIAVLIDPDSVINTESLIHLCKLCNANRIDYILVGGSLMTTGFFDECIGIIKSHTEIPVIIFPGDVMQVSNKADAILFLSLISGRNPDLLIGKQVLAAPVLKKSGIEVIPTGYILIDGGKGSSVSYMSNTTPIPAEKSSIAACTALAGEMLGLQITYMDAGSGALNPIMPKVIKAVKGQVKTPIFIGGGIRSAEAAVAACTAGADVVVIGNAFEKNPENMQFISNAVHSLNSETK